MHTHTVLRSGRFYFWPVIGANVVTMAIAVGADPIHAFLFSLVISCLASFGFLLNDLWDRDIDRVNNAGHFENSEAGTLRLGIVAGTGFLTMGLLLALRLGTAEVTVASILASALLAYTLLLRRLLFLPTIVAAVLASSPLWTPLVLWAKNLDVLKFSFVGSIVVILAAREIMMDARDRLGDVAGHRDTFPTVFGARIAKLMAVTLTLSGTLLLATVIAMNSSSRPVGNSIGAFALAGAIGYLLLRPSVRTILAGEEDRAAIQKYVYSSRTAMALIPLLNLISWRL